MCYCVSQCVRVSDLAQCKEKKIKGSGGMQGDGLC